jgi:hypothetical protein
MAKEISAEDWSAFQLRLHPDLVRYLEGRRQKSGLSLESEITLLVGAAMEAAEVPPPPTNSKFQCSESLMAETAECKDCGELIRHNAKLWAERHVQFTGHNVLVSLYYDMIDEGWLEKLTLERRAELEALRNDPAVARELARDLLDDLQSDGRRLQ